MEQPAVVPGVEWMNTLKDLTAGTIGGCSGIVAGQPLDTVKVRLQSTNSFTGPLDCLVKTVRNEGVRALFKGMSSPLLGNAPVNAIVFGAYGNASRYLEGAAPWLNDMSKYGIPTVAGMWGGFLQCVVIAPTELIKCKLQVQMFDTVKQYDGVQDCVRKMVRARGLMRGLYTGWWATVARDVPAFAAYFGVYEGLKASLQARFEPERAVVAKAPSMWISLMAGGWAGVVTWAITYPLDVIKSVQQTLPDTTPRAQMTLRHVTATAYAQHGWRFFVRGLGTTCLRAFPTNAVTFLVYEMCMDVFGRPES